MITLDFTGLHEPKCQGVEYPGTEKSDFELWSPHDDGRHGSDNKCFMGQQLTYIRRKQDVECYNGESFERQVKRSPCTCTLADYECDVNYKRGAGGTCEFINEDDEDNKHFNTDKETSCAEEGYYYKTQGYRKIPGNHCDGGV